MLAAAVSLGPTAGASEVQFKASGTRETFTNNRLVIGPERGTGVRVKGALKHVFHDFSKLDLSRGDEVRFVGPTSIRNVVARVSGGTPSTIDGKLSVRLGAGQLGDGPNVNPKNTANLWLVNPSGIVFGENSSFDVRGAVVVSTAKRLSIPDKDIEADAIVDSSRDSLLKVSRIGSFGFDDNPAGVTFLPRRRTDQLPAGQTALNFGVRDESVLSVVAGDVMVDRARIGSQRGRVNIVSVGSSGTVLLDPTDRNAPDPQLQGFSQRGNVTLRSFNPQGMADGTDTLETTTRIAAGGVDGDNFKNDGSFDGDENTFDAGNRVGGRVVIRAGKLELVSRVNTAGLDARINVNNDAVTAGEIAANGGIDPSSAGSVTARPGIDIGLTGDLIMRSGSAIDAIVRNAADSGGVTIAAASVHVLDGAKIEASVFRNDNVGARRGNAGPVTIDAGGPVRVVNTRPTVNSEQNLLTNDIYISAINSKAEDTTQTATSRSGDITIRAASLEIGLLGIISNTVRGAGDGGMVDIHTTGDVIVQNPRDPFDVFFEDGSPAPIRYQIVNIGRLDDPENTDPTLRTRTPGNLRSNGGTPTISSRTQPTGSGANERQFFNADGDPVGAGNAGTINLRAGGSVRLLAGGQINSASNAVGGEIVREGGTFFRPLRDDDGQVIRYGAAGTVIIEAAEALQIEGADSAIRVTADARRGGPAGAITVSAPIIDLSDGAQIIAFTSSAFSGGTITLQGIDGSAREVRLHEGAQIRTSSLNSASGDAGSIIIDARQVSLTENLSLPLEVLRAQQVGGSATQIKSTTSSLGDANLVDEAGNRLPRMTGNAGDVRIVGGTVDVGPWTQISANATAFVREGVPTYPPGRGGEVFIDADDAVLVHGHVARVEAATEGSGDGGQVTISAPRIEVVDGGQVRANSSPRQGARDATSPPPGNAGDVNIVVSDVLKVSGVDPVGPDSPDLQAGIVTTSSGGAGGEITIRGPGRIFVERGKIATTGSRTGGDINIGQADVDDIPGSRTTQAIDDDLIDANSPSVAIGDFGRIVANAQESFAGNIRINLASGGAFTQSYLGTLSARSEAGPQFNGLIDISSPEKDFSGELVRLNGELRPPDAFLHNCCELRVTRDLSSFTVKPREAVPFDPAGWQPVLNIRQ